MAVIAIIMLALLLQPASAQQAPIRYECSFRPAGSGGALRLEFVYDQPQNRAYLVGNAGVADVIAYGGTQVISFLEFLPTGAVQTTTIDPSGRAVHSRHTYSSASGFIQSQAIGQCSRR